MHHGVFALQKSQLDDEREIKMTFDITTLGVIFLLLMFLAYNYLIFEFANRILDNPKVKHLYLAAVGLFNTGLSYMLTTFDKSNSILGYVVAFVVFFVEFHLFYRDSTKRIMFVVTAYVIHIMALRSISVAGYALIFDKTLFEVANTWNPLVYTMAATFLMANISIVAVINLIPAKFIRVINQHMEQLNFMTTWIGIFSLYMLFNAFFYTAAQSDFLVVINQIVLPIVVLSGLYVVLYFAIKNGEMLGYKERNAKLQMEIHKEQQYRGAITKDTIINYEFNLTKNIITDASGLDLSSLKNKSPDHIIGYEYAIESLAVKYVFEDDLDDFVEMSRVGNMITRYNRGEREFVFEYRRYTANGDTIWVKAVTNLVRDDLTADINGYTYVKNIDSEKKEQLEWKFKAQRDSLTGVYNKGTTSKLIDDYLVKHPNRRSALYIFDIDNFKAVNDNLGHTFGDVVLSELSERLKTIFGCNDIIGRVGGDEFIAFVKDTENISEIKEFAQEICKTFQNSYQGDDMSTYFVTASVGIAVSPTHGHTFLDMYKNADIALYLSKSKGKNCFSIYNGEVFGGYESTRTEIDNASSLPQKSFKGNRIEYVFKILYGSNNSAYAVNAVLEMIGRHFKYSRSYIFQTDEQNDTIKNIFEWCERGIAPHGQQDILKAVMKNAIAKHYETGMYIVESVKNASSEDQEFMKMHDIKSMIQFAYFNGDELGGFIGFDDCDVERGLSPQDIDELSTICNVLATFISKQRITTEAENAARSMTAILNNLNSCAYVVNKDTFEIVFQNDKAMQSSPDAVIGSKCYTAYRGNDFPCLDCPMLLLEDEVGLQASKIIYNKKWGIWTDIVVSCINWTDGQLVRMVNCIDATKYWDSAPPKETDPL